MTVNIASEMYFNALRSLTQPCLLHTVSDAIPLYPRHFTKLCKLVYPWESASETQIIKETRMKHCQ